MNIVLVHGSFHGAWCWEYVIPLLEARGHRVVAPNLPASGGDPAPFENANLVTYATRIAAAIDELSGPVVLVGHSMGGIVSSQVAEWRPERLAAVVYVVGLLLRPGETLVSFLDAHSHLDVYKRQLLELLSAVAGCRLPLGDFELHHAIMRSGTSEHVQCASIGDTHNPGRYPRGVAKFSGALPDDPQGVVDDFLGILVAMQESGQEACQAPVIAQV